MAKQNCAICGVEINLFQQTQLSDKSVVCRKVCRKKAMKGFDFLRGTLPQLLDHIKQVEEGTKLYYDKLRKYKPKLKKQAGGLFFGEEAVLVAEDLGLIVRVEKRHKVFFFGKHFLASVFRIADLYAYEYEKASKLKIDVKAAQSGEKKPTHGCHFYFWDTPGMSDFVIGIDGKKQHKKLEKYFNTLFGIQKTIGNIGATWKNQVNAAKAVAGAVKAAASGDDNVEEKAGAAAEAMERMQYGDRSAWVAKAEAGMKTLGAA